MSGERGGGTGYSQEEGGWKLGLFYRLRFRKSPQSHYNLSWEYPFRGNQGAGPFDPF